MSKPTCAVCVTFHIKEEFIDSFRAAVTAQAKNSLEKESWCHQFDVCTTADSPNTFMLYETYDDRRAFEEKHRTTTHFAVFISTVEDWIESKQLGIWDIN
jgi:(4S)-4-hydroxy-5-phosphonooxypentane-2,3-dione isomerase